jgi:hypothetical protein
MRAARRLLNSLAGEGWIMTAMLQARLLLELGTPRHRIGAHFRDPIPPEEGHPIEDVAHERPKRTGR